MNIKFKKDVLDGIKDCILAIFWAKKDIISFFKNNGCTKNDLREVKTYNNLNRYEIIESLFSKLQNRNDNGLGQFTSILDSLCSWNYFNPFYFEELKKLDKNKAEKAISQLRRLRNKRNYKLEQLKKKKVEKTKKSNTKHITVTKLKAIMMQLYQGRSPEGKIINNQQRGYHFESFITELIKAHGLYITEPFKITGEQIDGALKYDGEHYLLEMKWHDNQSSSEALYKFAHKIEGKMYGRGIFISVNGFTCESVAALETGKALKTILVDGQDLICVLERIYTFTELLEEKIKNAQTKGKIYINIATNKDKF